MYYSKLSKNLEKAAEGLLGPGEQMLAGVYVTRSPVRSVGFGMSTGMMVGGVLGAAVGAVVDRGREQKGAGQEGAFPDVAKRPEVDPEIPKVVGGMIGITTERVLVWSVSGTGKPKGLLHQFPVSDVDTVAWQRVKGGGRLGGSKIMLSSVLLWIGLGSRVLAAAAVVQFPVQERQASEVVGALTDRCPGRVHEFTV